MVIIFKIKKNSSTLEYKSVPNHLNELLGILFFQKIKKSVHQEHMDKAVQTTVLDIVLMMQHVT